MSRAGNDTPISIKYTDENYMLVTEAVIFYKIKRSTLIAAHRRGVIRGVTYDFRVYLNIEDIEKYKGNIKGLSKEQVVITDIELL